MTQSTAYFWGSKGKQSQNRSGFRWAAPAHFPDGWSWAETSIEAYGALSAAKTRRQVTLFSQEAFSSLVRPETTYSWRRVVPSMGTLLSLQEVDLVSLGDWQDRGKVAASAAALPLYYSGTRYALSVRNKHLVLVEMSRCLSFDSWQEVSGDRLDASDSWLQDMKAEKVRLDSTTIWKDLVGTPGPESKLAFKTTALKLWRQSREAAASGQAC